jgi:hypothetical protein
VSKREYKLVWVVDPFNAAMNREQLQRELNALAEQRFRLVFVDNGLWIMERDAAPPPAQPLPRPGGA